MKLNEKILYYRKTARLSQEELAAQVGVSRQAVSKWELGDAAPEVDKLLALARAFGVTTDELLSGDEPPQREAQPTQTPEQTPPNAVPPAAGDSFDRATGWLGRMIGRYGWLLGVRVALSGLGFLLVGGLARWGFGAMFGTAGQMMGGFGEVTFSPGTPKAVQEAILAEMGLGAQSSPFSGVEGFFLGFANVLIVLGVLTVAGGVILAAVLYQKGRK